MIISIEGRIDALPVEVQEVLRDIVAELNDLTRRVGRGPGAPENRIVGYRGDVWQRTDGGTKTCVYVFEGTDGTAVGWQQLRT
jgi:hypothetical protein